MFSAVSKRGSQTPVLYPDELYVTEGWIADYGWILAVVLAVWGSTANNLGANLQKKALQIGDGKKTPKCMCFWWVGLLVMVTGGLSDIIALRYGPQSLLSPLASLSLVVNIGFARCIHKERVTKADVGYMAIIIAGCVMSVVFMVINMGDRCPLNRKQVLESLSSMSRFWGYIILLVTFIGLLAGVICYTEKHVLKIKKKERRGWGETGQAEISKRSRICAG